MQTYIYIYIYIYIHVAADWADIFDTPTKQEKTYLKPRCTPFPGNMSSSRETIAKHCACVCELERAADVCVSSASVSRNLLGTQPEVRGQRSAHL